MNRATVWQDRIESNVGESRWICAGSRSNKSHPASTQLFGSLQWEIFIADLSRHPTIEGSIKTASVLAIRILEGPEPEHYVRAA